MWRGKENLKHGDIYVMSEMAVGTDWKNYAGGVMKLRHAAGFSETFSKLKPRWLEGRDDDEYGTLWHVIHQDGDEEDLEEGEAETAVALYQESVKRGLQSNHKWVKQRVRRLFPLGATALSDGTAVGWLPLDEADMHRLAELDCGFRYSIGYCPGFFDCPNAPWYQAPWL